MNFERGDVLYGDDPFKGEEYARPWLVISNETHPYHGEQYVVLALTTRTWHDGVVEIPETAWLNGGTPAKSRIIPWSVETLEQEDVHHWQGSIDPGLVDRAVRDLVDYLENVDR
jgi:mRNA-degrading endonuclease toxin of MazEF toxin-antitoxin module